MDNNKIPPLEPEDSFPEDFQRVPEEMEPLAEVTVTDLFPEELPPEKSLPEETVEQEVQQNEVPQVEELVFEDLPAPEDHPADPEITQDLSANLTEEPAGTTEPLESSLEAEIPSEPDTPAEIVLAAEPEPETDPENIPQSPAPAAEIQPEIQEVFPEAPELQEDTFAFAQAPDTESRLPENAEEAESEEEILDQDYQDDAQEFETLFQNSTSEPVREKPIAAAFSHKGRPKRKKGEGMLGIPSILVTFVWLALIVMIGVTAGRMLWLCAADVLAFGREDKVVTVTIYEADTMEDIIDKLHAQGLIRYKSLFTLYADISDAEEDIKPGIYDLNTRYDYHALVNFMSPRSSREVIQLTIPEGYTCSQIFALLEENRVCTALDAASYAANGAISEYWFLEGVQRGSENCLEGYLFPDTYEFYKNSTPKEALERMLDNFEYRFGEEMIAQIAEINDQFGCDYSVREIVIIASLIEKESAAPGESPMVSGVIYNRLFDWGNNPPYLNIDASIVYAQGGENERIDTSLDSPYNTYAYEGLTPGPIANPGLASLKAALNPESHNYYYYVLNPSTGMHQFSTTYEEHTGYVRQFAAATEGQ